MIVKPVYHLELEEMSPSNNSIREMHPQAYKHMRRAWRMRILVALAAARRAPVDPALLLIRRYSSGSLDWDNAYGGLKPLLDCLVLPSARNPDGLGLIADDSPVHMPFPPLIRQEKAARGAGRTVLSIYEYSPETVQALAKAYVSDMEVSRDSA